MPSDRRSETRRLRRAQGLALRTIARRLGVSLGTVSAWTRDVTLTPVQLAALRARDGGWLGRSVAARTARLEAQERGRVLVRRGDPLVQDGCLLLWAGGVLTPQRVRFTSSDVDLVASVVALLRRVDGEADARLAVRVTYAPEVGLTEPEVAAWWLGRLALAEEQLTLAPVARRDAPPYGTARLSVSSVTVAQTILGAIQELADLERPQWLG